MQSLILDFLSSHPQASFVELSDAVPGFAGKLAMGSGVLANVILWRGISAEAVEALCALERQKKIRFEVITRHVYDLQGATPGLPVTTGLEDHDSPHWLPVLICGRKPGRKKLAP